VIDTAILHVVSGDYIQTATLQVSNKRREGQTVKESINKGEIGVRKYKFFLI